MGVVLASGANLEEARQRADQAAAAITVLPGG
jgi:formate-dependent phosphoribosylglycinamide formyltransferase (GAR transformylase)